MVIRDRAPLAAAMEARMRGRGLFRAAIWALNVFITVQLDRDAWAVRGMHLPQQRAAWTSSGNYLRLRRMSRLERTPSAVKYT